MPASKKLNFFNRIKLSFRTNGRPRWAAEFCKLARGIWQNFPWKTVGPIRSHKLNDSI